MAIRSEQPTASDLAVAVEIADRLLANIESVVQGKREEIRLVLTALACNGHVLFEDVPGTAKTVLARAVSGSIDGVVGTRIQCTPDLQPTDVTGLAVYDQRSRDFEFREGPIFANIVLVDEINRAMPKTQSALLEAMAERQVTVDGVTRAVPHPFLLLATENPIEYEGTFPLPEAQLDRFFLRTSLGYPTAEEELSVIDDQRVEHPLESLRAVTSVSEIEILQRAATDVYVDPQIGRWIVDLVRATREVPATSVGASVRGSLALERAVRAGRSCTAATSSFRPMSSCSFFPSSVTASCSRRRSSPRRARSGWQPRWPRSRVSAWTSHRPRRSCSPNLHARRRSVSAARPDVPARLTQTARRARLRRHARRAARHRLRHRRVAAVSRWRQPRSHRLGRIGAAVVGAQHRRVRRPEYFADEAPRAIVAVDSRPVMGLCPPGIPWLRKDEASGIAAELVEDSVAEARGFVGRLEFGARARRGRLVAAGRRARGRERSSITRSPIRRAWHAPARSRVPSNSSRYHRRSVPAASFVFVLSDFLAAPTLETWERALDRGWDIVPVIVQDPIWEQSFPDVDGIGMPLVDDGGRLRIVRLRRGESQVWRVRHEERLADLVSGMRSLGIEPVTRVVGRASRIFDAFVTWSAEREGAGRLGR